VYQRGSPETTGDTQEEALRLWRHLFGGGRALLWVWTGIRDEHGKTPPTTIKENGFAYPKAAASAAQ
jgi:hypothetical protein